MTEIDTVDPGDPSGAAGAERAPPSGRKGKGRSMLISTLIMGAMAVALLVVAQRKGVHVEGLKHSLRMTTQMLPLLFLALLIAGTMQALLPQETVARWIGEGSGFRGILVGSVAGAFTPGGPYVSLPIVAGLFRSGAGVGTMVAFLTAWSLWAASRLPLEFGILGWRLALIRLASTLVFPPIAGLIAQGLFGGVKP